MKLIISLIVILGLSWTGLLASFQIQRWEAANNYPYGKLCDVFRSCK